MYLRLTSNLMPRDVLGSLPNNAQYERSPDKSAVYLRGILSDQGQFMIDPITVQRHAVHVVRHPKLGAPCVQIITTDDGPTELAPIPKSKFNLLDELPYHYRVHLMRVDMP
jgi:hypothetical protein